MIAAPEWMLRAGRPGFISAPLRIDQSPARMPPSGKMPMTRPSASRWSAWRREVLSEPPRSTEMQLSQVKIRRPQPERKSSSMASQSSLLGKNPLMIGGSKWLMWFEAMISAPCFGTGASITTRTRQGRVKSSQHPLITNQ